MVILPTAAVAATPAALQTLWAPRVGDLPAPSVGESPGRIDSIRRRFHSLRCAEVEKIIAMMANPIRFHVLCALVAQPFSVSELVQITGANLPNVSQQLKQLWLGGYVAKERRSKQIVYRIADERLPRLIGFLETLFPDAADSGCE